MKKFSPRPPLQNFLTQTADISEPLMHTHKGLMFNKSTAAASAKTENQPKTAYADDGARDIISPQKKENNKV